MLGIRDTGTGQCGLGTPFPNSLCTVAGDLMGPRGHPAEVPNPVLILLTQNPSWALVWWQTAAFCCWVTVSICFITTITQKPHSQLSALSRNWFLINWAITQHSEPPGKAGARGFSPLWKSESLVRRGAQAPESSNRGFIPAPPPTALSLSAFICEMGLLTPAPRSCQGLVTC